MVIPLSDDFSSWDVTVSLLSLEATLEVGFFSDWRLFFLLGSFKFGHSQYSFLLLQAVHEGFSSSHFLCFLRQLKQPVLTRFFTDFPSVVMC